MQRNLLILYLAIAMLNRDAYKPLTAQLKVFNQKVGIMIHQHHQKKNKQNIRLPV